jgi:hypothetical protein
LGRHAAYALICRDRAAFRRPGQPKKPEACFIVRDHNGQALAYVYFEEEPACEIASC